jgi:type IV pilus assembly protein PilV
MSKHSGFTLVEVLIAMLLLAGGLLGMAALQANSLASNQTAFNRSIATTFAHDLADRMRANSSALATYVAVAPTAAVANGDCTITTGCSPVQMAQNDLFEWNQYLQISLPNAQSSVSLAGTIYTISITWDDNRDGTIDANDPSFQTSFRL